MSDQGNPMTKEELDALQAQPSLATGAELTSGTFANFVQRLRHHVQGEGVSWHHTADALFTVEARRIIFGIDPDYTSNLAVGVDETMYFSPQEYWDNADESTHERLNKESHASHDADFLGLDESDQWRILGDLDDHTVSGWDERWEYVNSHFTKEAAEAFIQRKKHDYRHGLRVYVEAQVYCWEFNAIIKGLLNGDIDWNRRADTGKSAAIADAAEALLDVLDEYPEQLVPINRKSATVNALREALGADTGKSAEAWQPIETAPKDGRTLILLLTPSGWPQVAWSNTWWTAGFSVENKPMGWAPIPQPISGRATEGGKS